MKFKSPCVLTSEHADVNVEGADRGEHGVVLHRGTVVVDDHVVQGKALSLSNLDLLRRDTGISSCSLQDCRNHYLQHFPNGLV